MCQKSSVICYSISSLQRGSNYGSLLTMEGNVQIYAKTCYYKVRELFLGLFFFRKDDRMHKGSKLGYDNHGKTQHDSFSVPHGTSPCVFILHLFQS